MKKMKTRRLLIFTISLTIFFSFYNNVQASNPNATYSKNINVGLTSMGNISNLNFSINDDYIVVNQGIQLKKNTNYNISSNAGILTIKQNGNVLLNVNQDILLKPLNDSSLITFNGISYLGSIRFKNNGNEFLVINSLKIEDYLIGVLPYEVSESFPIEALKAQAVAARTYALNHKSNSDYDVSDNTSSQMYKGYDPSNKNCIQAIKATKGEVLTYNGDLIDALFSASDGGFTEVSENVWSASYPYLTSRKDDFDAVDKSYKYYSEIVNYLDSDIETIIKKHLDWDCKKFVKIDIPNIKTFTSGRISSLPIIYIDNKDQTQTKCIGKNEARTFFNLSSTKYLKSAKYTVTCTKDESTQQNKYSFDVKGYGHGLGLSQWGAYYRAKSGQSYKEILNFYYIKTTLQNVASVSSIAEFDTYVGGNDRYATSISIGNKAFSPSSSNKIKNVVIATGAEFADALSGSVLAKKYNAPILLVEGKPDTASSSKVIDYINNNVDKAGKVYILGGKGVIDSSYETKFKQIGFNNVIRLGGKNRIETSNTINNEINANINTPIVIATAKDFPDALSVSPIAASKGWPIFLVEDDLQIGLQNYIAKNKPTMVYIAGGTGVVSDSIKNKIKGILNYGDDKVVRLGGANRYETSKIINSIFVPKTEKVLVATGIDFADALSGSVYAGINSYPIVLTDSTDSSNAAAYIESIYDSVNMIHIEALGLQGAVDQNTINKLTSIKK